MTYPSDDLAATPHTRGSTSQSGALKKNSNVDHPARTGVYLDRCGSS